MLAGLGRFWGCFLSVLQSLRPEQWMPAALVRNGVTGGDGFSDNPDTLKAGAPMILQLISAGSSAL